MRPRRHASLGARCCLVLLLVHSPRPANADDREPEAAATTEDQTPSADELGGPAPWAEGVSQAEQQRALALFREGNALFESSQHAGALSRYRSAISHWDHPAIRFNMVVCFVHLDEPLLAWENLEVAMAHGPAALQPGKYEQGVTYRKLLRAQLGELEIVCDEPGAIVTLDGQPALACPGTARRMAIPGSHQIVASKPGHLTSAHTLHVRAGGMERVEVELLTVDRAVVMKRRWNEQTPWWVMGAGGAGVLLGAPLLLWSKREFDAYDKRITELCESGCSADEVPDAVRNHRTRGRTLRASGYSVIVAGGAAIAVGVVMAMYNEPRATNPGESAPTVVTPILTGESLGVGLTGRF